MERRNGAVASTAVQARLINQKSDMKTKLSCYLFTLALLTFLFIGVNLSTVHAQGTAFTYQGQLQNNGGPASGTYNIAFSLYATNTSGSPIAGPVTNVDVVITNGLFTVTIDFGSGVFMGATNWLQIYVATNGVNNFTLLTPRQQLTPVPYAIFAATATTAGNASTATAASTANNFSGSLAGDVTGTQGATVISTVGGVSAANVAGGANAANAATSANTASTIVKRDGLGNFSAGIITANGAVLNNLNASQLTGGVISNSVLPGFQGNDNAIGGGVGNTVIGPQSAILGGQDNTNNASQSSIGGGSGNIIQSGAYYAFIGGGGGSVIQTNAYDSVIDGGYHNTIQSNAIVSVIGGGQFNTTTSNASFAVIGGGLNNTNFGSYSMIPGGKNNLAAANSFAAGSYAQATNSGSFVWSDNSSSTPFASTNNNSFNVRASGGVTFVTGGTGVAVDGASIITATAGAIQESEINDGGSAAYSAFQQTVQGAGGDTSVPFSEIYPMVATNGSSPALTLTVNGATLGSVVGFSGYEGISQPYSYVVEVLNSTTILPNTEIGLAASLSFTRNGKVTTFAGMITACTLASSDGTGFVYTVKLGSPLANLGLTTDYRIYQNLAATAVASSVYTAVSPDAPLTQNLTGSYVVHQSLTQFGETSLNFFNRILENEGIFYFYNQSATPPSLVLGDNPAAYLSSPNSPFPYYGNTATNIPAGMEYIRTFQNAAYQNTRNSTVNAYDFTTPDTSLSASAQSTPGVGLYYEFGNAVATTAYDLNLAETRAGVQTENRVTISGSATIPDLRAGYTFTLTDQTGAGLGNSYLVTSIHHAGFVLVTNGVSTFFYGNEFTAIPVSVPYNPALKTPKPIAQPCLAKVTGPAGQEIYTDKYGRVKVLFHWDHYDADNDTSSAWIRVASPWAGSGRGMYFNPRVGDEVLVSFIQGDPDQPVITGSLYNGDNTVPYPLPGNKAMSGLLTLSTPGGGGNNELRFDDTAGAEEIALIAERDMLETINNNLTETVDNNLSLKVANDFSITASQTILNGPLDVNGVITGDGDGLTNLDASQLASGSVPAALLTSVPAGSLTGTIPPATLPSSVAQLNQSQTFTGINAFDNNLSVIGSQAGGFNSPLELMQNNNTSGNTAPALRMIGYGNSPNGVLSVSSQGTGLIAEFGNANAFVADINSNGVVDASGFAGGTLRVGSSGTTFTNIQSGQAIMPSSSTVETNYTVTFPQAFTTVPKVIASISGDTNFPAVNDTFAMSIRALTSTTGFTVNVVRVDASSGWSQQLRINWQAWQ